MRRITLWTAFLFGGMAAPAAAAPTVRATIEGDTNITLTEDVAERFLA